MHPIIDDFAILLMYVIYLINGMTVVLDVYHKPAPITTPIASMCMHASVLFMLVN